MSVQVIQSPKLRNADTGGRGMGETLITSSFFDDVAWVLKSAASFEESNRSSIASLKEVSSYLRDPFVGGIVLVLTTIYLIRGRIDRIAIFFSSMMSKYPLPAARRLGVKDEHIQSTRELLFFLHCPTLLPDCTISIHSGS